MNSNQPATKSNPLRWHKYLVYKYKYSDCKYKYEYLSLPLAMQMKLNKIHESWLS